MGKLEELLGWPRDPSGGMEDFAGGNGPLDESTNSNQSTDESAYGPPIVMVSWHPTKEAIAFLIGQSRRASTVWIWQHRFGLRKLQRSELIKLLHPKGKIDEPNPITADIKEWKGDELHVSVGWGRYGEEQGAVVAWNLSNHTWRVISPAAPANH